jgi:hypothetical protein
VSTPNDFQLWHLGINGNPPPGGIGPGGVQHPNVYASEFGTAGSSSFESMSGALSKQHWGLHGGMEEDTCDNPTKVRKKSFFAPFIYKMHDFTKTGSGQT